MKIIVLCTGLALFCLTQLASTDEIFNSCQQRNNEFNDAMENNKFHGLNDAFSFVFPDSDIEDYKNNINSNYAKGCCSKVAYGGEVKDGDVFSFVIKSDQLAEQCNKKQDFVKVKARNLLPDGKYQDAATFSTTSCIKYDAGYEVSYTAEANDKIMLTFCLSDKHDSEAQNAAQVTFTIQREAEENADEGGNGNFEMPEGAVEK